VGRALYEQVERIVSLVVLLAREEPLALHNKMLEGGATYRRFLFLSPDLIVDQWGRVFLEEMNTNGFMPGDDVLYHMQADTASVVHLLGADGFPSRPMYENKVLELWKGFCERRTPNCAEDPVDEPSLRSIFEAVDEEVHAFSTSWYRIFPSLLTSAHEVLQDLAPKFVTPRDAFLRDWLRYRVEFVEAQRKQDDAG